MVCLTPVLPKAQGIQCAYPCSLILNIEEATDSFPTRNIELNENTKYIHRINVTF